MKKIVTLLLAIILLFSAFTLIACDKGEGAAGTGTGATTTTEKPKDPEQPKDPETPETPEEPEYVELPENYVGIAVNGESEYVIRYPYDKENELRGVCEQIAAEIKAKTGVDIAVKSDFIVGNSKPLECEILVGSTNRVESTSAISKLKKGQFAVKLCDKKIVLAGRDASAVSFAVGYFLESVVGACDYGKNLGVEIGLDKTYSANAALKIDGVDISKFTIVIPEKFLGSDYRVAVYLKKHISDVYGADLEIYTDVNTYDHEILIGSTKRTTADAPATAHGYSADIKDGKVQLQAASVYAYDALSSYLQTRLFNPIKNEYSSGYSTDKDVTSTLKDGQEYTTKRDGDMRIMFFNMWGNSTTAYGPRDQHQMLAAEICNAYAPDVIGFQEFNNHNRDDGWWSMDSLLEEYGYREVVEFEYVRKWLDDKGGKHETGVISDGTRPTNNFTPIFYNPNKVTLVKADFVPYGERNEEGYHLVDTGRGYNGYYMMHNDYFSKSLTWAVFKDNATGKQFGVLSTHFWYASGTDGNNARVENARVVNATVASMRELYPDLPIFVGGDFNCTNSSDPYKKLTGEGGLVDVQGIATRTEDHKTYHTKQDYDPTFVAGNKNVGIDINKNNEESDRNKIVSGYIGTWTAWYHPGGDYDGAIDHIFIKDTADKLDIKMFDIVASKMALLASDHCPLICDFDLK